MPREGMSAGGGGGGGGEDVRTSLMTPCPCLPGYMEVVQIPKGSVHIEIKELAMSKNYIGKFLSPRCEPRVLLVAGSAKVAPCMLVCVLSPATVLQGWMLSRSSQRQPNRVKTKRLQGDLIGRIEHLVVANLVEVSARCWCPL